jgi:hypothetical protein
MGEWAGTPSFDARRSHQLHDSVIACQQRPNPVGYELETPISECPRRIPSDGQQRHLSDLPTKPRIGGGHDRVAATKRQD